MAVSFRVSVILLNLKGNRFLSEHVICATVSLVVWLYVGNVYEKYRTEKVFSACDRGCTAN